MQQLASQLLSIASAELDHCRALLSALDEQREVLLARDAPGVLRVCRTVEAILADMARAAADRSNAEAELLALLVPSGVEGTQRLDLNAGEPSRDAIADVLSESDRDRWRRLNRDLAGTARRIHAANDFNQQLVIDAIAYQDLMLRLLSGHADEDTYPVQGERGRPVKRPATKRAPIPVFLNQSA